MQISKQILREPLVHFLLIGALMYLYFDLSKKDPALQQKEQITLLKFDLKQLAQQTELKDETLLLDYLRYKKSLLADAYSLELFKDDKKIQNILLQKMEFILNANAKIKEPSEEDLKTYYTQHPKDFSKLKSFDLKIIAFEPNIDLKVIEKLRLFGNLNNAGNMQKLQATTPKEVAQKFGRYIAMKIVSTAENHWSKPLKLNDKTYVFYIYNKKVGSLQPFADVEGQVYEQYLYTKNTQALRQAYQQLLNHYIIKVQ